MTYYDSYYTPSDINSDLEEARDAITRAISQVEEMEEIDFDDKIAEATEEAVNDARRELMDLIGEFSSFQTRMSNWISDSSDQYTVTNILSGIVRLINTHESAPYASEYQLARRIEQAVRELNTARKEEIEAAEKQRQSNQESAGDTAAY